MVTKRQYQAAQRKLEKAQNKHAEAQRNLDQDALDKAGDEAVKALAVIAEYKNQKATKKNK